MVAAIALACGVWTLVRIGGFDGSFDIDFAWRWSPTPEERLLLQGEELLAVAEPCRSPGKAPRPQIGSHDCCT